MGNKKAKQVPDGLRDRRGLWLEAVTGDDPNSVQRQLLQFGEDLATFTMINEARRLAPVADDGSIQANGQLHELFDRGFFTVGVTTIRRQCKVEDLDGPKGVLGLATVLRDIINHADLLTRAAILDAEELPYDYEPGLKQHWIELIDRAVPGQAVHSSVPPSYWAELRHEHLDWACQVEPSQRSAADMYDRRIFERLLERVEVAGERAVECANKFVAHAASRESRARAPGAEQGVSIGYLTDAFRILCETTAFLTVEFLHSASTALLPHTLYDPTEALNKPLVLAKHLPTVKGSWDRIASTAEAASRWGCGAFETEFPRRTRL